MAIITAKVAATVSPAPDTSRHLHLMGLRR